MDGQSGNRPHIALAMIAQTFRILLWSAIILAIPFALMVRSTDFTRPVPVDNDPLTNAIPVVSISGNELHLANGKTFVLDNNYYGPEPVSQLLQAAGNRIELVSDGTGYTLAYIRRKSFRYAARTSRCVLPLFQAPYPANYRASLGWGTFR